MDDSQPGTTREGTVSLDSATRTTAIHPLLPDIRVPGQTPQDPSPEENKNDGDDNDDGHNDTVLKTHHYHPLSCEPIDTSNLPEEQEQELESLRSTYTPSAAQKAQDQAAHDARARIEWINRRRDEVQRAIDKKVKERNTEMKVLEKYQGDAGVKAKSVLP